MPASRSASAHEPTRYELDEFDTISSVGGAWDQFAIANEAPHLQQNALVGRPLLNSITGDESKSLYRRILERVRQGRRISVPFRCDAPGVRRFMELHMVPAEAGRVRCEAVTIRLEHRTPIALLSVAAPRGNQLVRMCAWCKRVAVGFKWVEVEDAVAALGLFNIEAGPRNHARDLPKVRAHDGRAHPVAVRLRYGDVMSRSARPAPLSYSC